MRRPPGLWILLSAGVVWLSLQDVYGIRATSLIFGKTSTTTTSTTAAPEQAAASEEETVTTESSADANSTKPTLTGNPQLDYIWDPNLPKELNGYNLSDYPFYERVPEDIDFKCDGLHDGFYASVAHKCQVYHHCLARTRYDFLCANYTAFDQRTFICHFASEIDCANSKKYWHRNDNLYKATTTSTIKPIVIHTPPPEPTPMTLSPKSKPSAAGPRRPNGGRRRPFRRRRPQFDYYEDDDYDDYYEERPRSNRGRKRPRPRPRPLYDDEYDDEYEDDRYERRGGSRREEKHRPYDRRPNGKRRSQDRGKHDYEVDSDRFEDEDFKLHGRKKINDRKTYDEESDDDRYPETKNRRRPTTDRSEDENKPRKGQRRPVNDDYEDDTLQRDDSRSYERPRKNDVRRTTPKEEPKTIIKPVSGTIYDRPRVAPRIKLPVPKNEANKYAYKPIGSTTAATAVEDEDDYEYEDDLPKRKNFRTPSPKVREDSRKEISTESRPRPRRPEPIYEAPVRPRLKETRPRPKTPARVEYYDDYEEYEDEEEEVKRPANSGEKRGKSPTSTTTEQPIEKVYHHCLFGTRYDFLCANYTAFDQTLFNCNFASNVDCENSKKFWSRNDELYIEKSTTTAAPPAYNFYTPPPQAALLTPSPTSLRQLPPLPPPEPVIPRRQPAPRGRPYARPRPLYDYDEEEYEELPRPKARKRRPRPRPLYYDDYEDEYEEERPPRRGGGRRRPYWRDRAMRRTKDRRKFDYDDADYRFEYDDVILGKSQKEKRRKLLDDEEFEEDRRDRYERRRPANRRSDAPLKKADKRTFEEDDVYEEETRYQRRNPKDEVRDFDRRRPLNEDDKNPRLGKRRPPSEDFEDDLQRTDNSRSGERVRKGSREGSYIKPPEDGRPIIKPVSGTIYDRPRVAPRINLPVPKNAAEKFSYKPIDAKTLPTPQIDDDIEEEEEEEEEVIIEPPVKRSKYDRRNSSFGSDIIHASNTKSKEVDHSESPPKTNVKPKTEARSKSATAAPEKKSIGKGLTAVDYQDYYDDDLEEEKPSSKDEVKLVPAPTSTTTTEAVVEQPMPIVRKFKRPFLPSRGGNPFSARSLQPVGSKASSRNEAQGIVTEETSISSISPDSIKTDNEEIQEVKADLRPIPVRVMSPILAKSTTATPEVTSSITEESKSVEVEPEIKPGPVRIKVPIRQNQNGHGYKLAEPEATEVLTKSDILNGNYDVTLNEAISPIIPKLPVRSYGGFAPTNDYAAYKRIQRPTKFVILDPVVSDVSPYYVK